MKKICLLLAVVSVCQREASSEDYYRQQQAQFPPSGYEYVSSKCQGRDCLDQYSEFSGEVQNEVPDIEVSDARPEPIVPEAINDDDDRFDVEACEPQVSVVTNTQFVPTTVFSIRTRALPTTIFSEITQTQVVSTTVLRQETITSLAAPVIQTSTEVIPQTEFITRAQYFTVTSYATETRVRTQTATRVTTRTVAVTKTETTIRVKTRLSTQVRTVPRTEYRVREVTTTKELNKYLTKTIASSVPVFHTVTNTLFRERVVTVTNTFQTIQAEPVFQTVYHTRFVNRFSTLTKTLQNRVPVVQTITSFRTKVVYTYAPVSCPKAAPVTPRTYY